MFVDKRKPSLAILVMTIILIPALFCFISTSDASSKEPIKIGIVQSVSGMVSDFALEDLEGFRVKINEVNAMGGVETNDGKRQIELIVRDNKLKPDIAVKNAKSLILQEKVDFLVGCISSSCALAVSEVAKEHKILFWVWDARTHHLTGSRGHRYVFRSTGNTWMNGHAAANYFKDKPFTRWGLINPDYSYGRSQYDAFVHGMKSVKPDFNLVSEQWPKLGTTDFTPYITALLSAKPEIIYTSLWGTDAMTFIKQAKGYGFFKRIKYVGLFHGMPLLRPMGQEMVEDIYVLTESPFAYPGNPENKAFYDAYKARTGKLPSSYSIGGYNAGSFIVAGIEKAGTVETESLIDALEGITIKTIAPAKTITIRKCDHQSDYGITIGKSAKDPKWPWYIVKDVEIIPGAPTMPTCDEVAAERAAAKQ